MAGDWIKMRVCITRDPKVLAMTDYLAEQREFMDWLTDPVREKCDVTCYEHVTRNVTRCVTVVALLQVWGMANEVGHPENDDIVLRHATLDRLDEIADVPCFGAAMASVGWAIEEQTASGSLQVRFPNFLTHNVPVEDRQRTGAALRQRRFRERHRQDGPQNAPGEEEEPTSPVTLRVTLQSNAREEKRRVGDESPTTPLARSRENAASGQPQPSVNGFAGTQNYLFQLPAPADVPAPAADSVVLTFPVVGGRDTVWNLTASKLAEYRTCYPGLDALAEVRKALQWLRDNPSRRKTPRGMTRFLGSWLGRAQNRSPGKGPPPPLRETPAEYTARMAAERAASEAHRDPNAVHNALARAGLIPEKGGSGAAQRE